MAVWAVRRDPLAIAALFMAVAAILCGIPCIMAQRSPFGDGTARHLAKPGAEADTLN